MRFEDAMLGRGKHTVDIKAVLAQAATQPKLEGASGAPVFTGPQIIPKVTSS